MTSLLLLEVLQAGGLAPGGLNFDAKVRRSSIELEDMFISHISAMDTLAGGLIVADQILRESDIMKMRKRRYASFDSGNGAKFEKGKLSLSDLRDLAVELGEPKQVSGKQELYEAIVNQYI